MNYKNIVTGEIISYTCYQKLTVINQQDYIEVADEPTHKLNEDGGNRLIYKTPKYATNFAMFEGLNDSHGGASYDF